MGLRQIGGYIYRTLTSRPALRCEAEAGKEDFRLKGSDELNSKRLWRFGQECVEAGLFRASAVITTATGELPKYEGGSQAAAIASIPAEVTALGIGGLNMGIAAVNWVSAYVGMPLAIRYVGTTLASLATGVAFGGVGVAVFGGGLLADKTIDALNAKPDMLALVNQFPGSDIQNMPDRARTLIRNNPALEQLVVSGLAFKESMEAERKAVEKGGVGLKELAGFHRTQDRNFYAAREALGAVMTESLQTFTVFMQSRENTPGSSPEPAKASPQIAQGEVDKIPPKPRTQTARLD